MTDMKVCEDEDAGLITTDWEDTSLPGNSQEECQRTLCRARNQVCAGYLLEEMGRSPLPRTLVAAELLGRPFDIADDLLVDTARCSTAMAKANLPEDCAGRTASRLRFKPQQAPGRAAALRGAMNRYREAGIVTRAMTLLTPAQIELGHEKCTVILATGNDGGPHPSGLGSEPGKPAPTLIDVFYQTFNDAAAQYSGVLPQTVTAMQESAEFQVKGGATALAEIATQWNGEVDSALAATKLLTMTSESAVGIPDLFAAGDRVW